MPSVVGYANSLLATLNSRAALRSKGMDIENSPMRFSTVMGIEHARVSRAISHAANVTASTGASEGESDETSESAGTGVSESSGEQTVKRVSRVPSRPVPMAHVGGILVKDTNSGANYRLWLFVT